VVDTLILDLLDPEKARRPPMAMKDYSDEFKADAVALYESTLGAIYAVGSSADNAAAESFNAAFKRETLKGRKGWSNEHEARLDAFRWLTRYNTRRRHSRLGQRPPIAYENDLQPAATTLAQAA
jgi:transposase InsO family protein